MTRVSALLLLALLAPASGCGREPERPLELLDFRQNELDAVGLNEELVFYFSENLEHGSVTSESVRILGPQGRVVSGQRVVRANALSFLPDLPRASDLSDGGLRPRESYRVVLGGFPRPDGLRAESGAVLSASLLLSFRTAEPGGKSPLFLDPFTGPFPLIPHGKYTAPNVIVLEDGILVLESGEALDPSSVPAAQFEILHVPPGASEPESVPLVAHLVVNLREHSELLLEPIGDAFSDRRLAPDKYTLDMTNHELRTLGNRAVEPGWRKGGYLTLVVPSARVPVAFDEPRDRAGEQPPACTGTAHWGDLEAAAVAERGLYVRFPAAAGSGLAGSIELHQPPTAADLQATRLEVPADARVDLSELVGPVVLRSQTVLEVRGRLTRSGAAAQGDPITTELERAAELSPEHWAPLSPWVERLIATGRPDERPAGRGETRDVLDRPQPWTVLIAGGDIRVPAGGSIEVDGPLVLIAGGWIRVEGAVRSQGDIWRTSEGGGMVGARGRLARLPLVLDPPSENPLRAPLVVGLLTQPFSCPPRGNGWRPVLVGHQGSGRLEARFLQVDPALDGERALVDPSAFAPGPIQALLQLEVRPGAGEAWDPPRLEHLELEAIPGRAPATARR